MRKATMSLFGTAQYLHFTALLLRHCNSRHMYTSHSLLGAFLRRAPGR
jgi:hypothetical protein